MTDIITIDLSGRIDSNNASTTEENIRLRLSGYSSDALILDASKLDYISSAGLRILLRLKKTYPELSVINVSPDVYEILDMTGFTEILTVEKAYRSVSIEGCELIGEGANGKVYRIDHDNVVKIYKNDDALSEIQHEREVARLALILGIPTAISYDVVKVGDNYGSVFELLDARSFAGIIAEESERIEWCVKEYAALLRTLHGTEVPEGKLSSIKEAAIKALGNITHILPAGYAEKLTRLVNDIPERNTMIHGDCHTKNIVLAGDEVLLIDMDTLAVGHPIFELAQMYNSYVGFGELDPSVIARFQGFSADTARDLWRRVLKAYLELDDDKAVDDIEDKIRCVAYIRLIDWSGRHHDPGDPDDMALLDLWKSELISLLDRVDTLDFDISAESSRELYETELDAVTENLPLVSDHIEKILDSVSCPFKTRMQIAVAVEEIFVNVSSYAYAPGTGKVMLRVELSRDPYAVSITFTDSGIPYDPLKKKDPDITLPAEMREIGGLGIFMTKKTMDDVIYSYENGHNILTLKKSFTPDIR